MSLDRKFNGDSKNVLKTVILSRQVGFTGDFVPDCPFKLCFWQIKLRQVSFFPDCTKFCVFLGYWIGNLMGIPKMCLKQSFSYYK